MTIDRWYRASVNSMSTEVVKGKRRLLRLVVDVRSSKPLTSKRWPTFCSSTAPICIFPW